MPIAAVATAHTVPKHELRLGGRTALRRRGTSVGKEDDCACAKPRARPRAFETWARAVFTARKKWAVIGVSESAERSGAGSGETETGQSETGQSEEEGGAEWLLKHAGALNRRMRAGCCYYGEVVQLHA